MRSGGSNQNLRNRRFTPLETLFDRQPGGALPIPPGIAILYGPLKMPSAKRAPYLYSNFVTSLDGVVSLGIRGHLGGPDISRHNVDDRMVMGLLRAVADVIMIGAGTLRADPGHLWTAAGICPELADEYRVLRETLGKPPVPVNLIVSGSGRIDPCLPVFTSGLVRGIVLTTNSGVTELTTRVRRASSRVQVLTSGSAKLTPSGILRVIRALGAGNRVLLEGGPRLLGEFYARGLLDAQFLTVAPQVFGRTPGDQRLSLVMDQLFSPGHGRRGRLVGAKRGASHLFLRYSFGVG